jgi:hypothetical protein
MPDWDKPPALLPSIAPVTSPLTSLRQLEVDVEFIKRDIAEMKSDVRTLRTDLDDLRIAFARLAERVAAAGAATIQSRLWQSNAI